MKKRIGKLIITATVAIVVFLICGTLFRKAKAEEAGDRIRFLPELTLTDINGNIFRTDQITSGPLLITYFHPECDHCRYEIASILSSDLVDCDLNILLVSHADLSQIKTFMEQFDMKEYPFVNVLHDPDLSFREIFRADIIPSNFIYNKELQLTKALRGETTSEAIIKYLYSSDK